MDVSLHTTFVPRSTTYFARVYARVRVALSRVKSNYASLRRRPQRAQKLLERVWNRRAQRHRLASHRMLQAQRRGVQKHDAPRLRAVRGQRGGGRRRRRRRLPASIQRVPHERRAQDRAHVTPNLVLPSRVRRHLHERARRVGEIEDLQHFPVALRGSAVRGGVDHAKEVVLRLRVFPLGVSSPLGSPSSGHALDYRPVRLLNLPLVPRRHE
eukprot:5529-Pelagococcus_subviridis.AAC.2